MTAQEPKRSQTRLLLATAFFVGMALLVQSCTWSSHDDYSISLSADPQSATRLLITQEINGKLASKGLMHALILPADRSTMYHEHPREQETGKFVLDLPAHSAGEYDVWIEITVGSGHADAILKRFTLNLPGRISPAQDAGALRITLQPGSLELKPAGSVSHLEFLISLDGAPVTRFGKFVGVSVHSFAVSMDRKWFKHDHAEPTGNGKVKAHFEFPRAGEYVIFLQPTVAVEGRELRPMLGFGVKIPD